jgi:hypothetical protein
MQRIPMACLAFFIAVPTAAAHRPFFSAPEHGAPETAFPVSEPEVSQVLYHEASCAVPRVWLAMDLVAGQEVFVQLGVPVLERLADYRPVLALVGPGLRGELPFAAPAKGGMEIAPLSGPREFLEVFTGTSSWILVERTIQVPATGRYYLVAWHPEQRPGKLWVAVGTEERFSMEELLGFAAVRRRVRAFHELDQEDSRPVAVEPCPAPAPARQPEEPRAPIRSLSVGKSTSYVASLRCSSVPEGDAAPTSRLALLVPGRISSVDRPVGALGAAGGDRLADDQRQELVGVEPADQPAVVEKLAGEVALVAL